MNQNDISKVTGIESTVITKYKKGTKKPTLRNIILLSIAMKLTPDRSNYLLYVAGFQLNNSLEHRIYKLFLSGCAFNSDYNIENCDKLLLSKGLMKIKN